MYIKCKKCLYKTLREFRRLWTASYQKSTKTCWIY